MNLGLGKGDGERRATQGEEGGIHHRGAEDSKGGMNLSLGSG
jgi:hypothetical protein